MSEIYKLNDKELSDINNILISKTNISDSSHCFCGSNKEFSDCCKTEPNSWSIKTSFDKELVDFLKSKDWNKVDNQDILFLLPKFKKYYLESFDMCARPGCSNKTTVNSHVYGKKHVEKYLTNNKCKIPNINSSETEYFNVVDTGKPITYRIFCNTCEQLFENIDNPEHDILDDQNAFLHILRTQSYQYQYCRFDLAFAHQFILYIKGVLETERHKNTGRANTVINLDWFLANNIRYQHQAKLRDKLWVHFGKKVNIPHIHSRCFSVEKVVFACGIYNPSHNLRGVPIIYKEDASFFYYLIPKDAKSIYVTIASFDDEYKEMIKQLANINEYDFKKYLNHLLSFCGLPLNLILQDTHKITDQMINKINKKKALTLKNNPKKPSDLESRKVFAKFIG
ncbi:MAG: hypothetical protein WC791_03655 [Candidatus Paceibacterota bacterium]|jgi:hypothetical protein